MISNAFIPVKRVYNVNTYSCISTVPRGSEQSEWAEWTVRVNECKERPSGPFKTRLSRVETGPKSINFSKFSVFFCFLLVACFLVQLQATFWLDGQSVSHHFCPPAHIMIMFAAYSALFMYVWCSLNASLPRVCVHRPNVVISLAVCLLACLSVYLSVNLCVCVCVGGRGGCGEDGGWMPLPTHPQQCCDPASLVLLLWHSRWTRWLLS